MNSHCSCTQDPAPGKGTCKQMKEWLRARSASSSGKSAELQQRISALSSFPLRREPDPIESTGFDLPPNTAANLQARESRAPHNG